MRFGRGSTACCVCVGVSAWSLTGLPVVISDPSLRDPASIGHRFTDVMLWELKVGGGGSTIFGSTHPISSSENAREALEGLCILAGGDRMRRPNDH